jgi:hypothetical protein
MELMYGIYFILLGLFFIVFHSKFNELALKLWKKRFPNIKIWQKCYSFSFLVCGIVFIVFGFLSVFQIIKLK